MVTKTQSIAKTSCGTLYVKSLALISFHVDIHAGKSVADPALRYALKLSRNAGPVGMSWSASVMNPKTPVYIPAQRSAVKNFHVATSALTNVERSAPLNARSKLIVNTHVATLGMSLVLPLQRQLLVMKNAV